MVDDHTPPPPSVQCRRFLTQDIRPGERVLDVGCGDGDLMRVYLQLGCEVVGVEVDEELVRSNSDAGLDVRQGVAEALPFQDAEFDRIVCSVVIPYTDERLAVAEWARVLKPDGLVLATFHGTGYGWDYLLKGDNFWRRVYGGRMLVNTAWYRLTGRRLPGFLGDTLCQGPRRLERYFHESGLTLESKLIVDRCCGLPRFFGVAGVMPAVARQRLVPPSDDCRPVLTRK